MPPRRTPQLGPPSPPGGGVAALQHHLHLAQHQRVLAPGDEDGDEATRQAGAADGAERAGAGVGDDAAAAGKEETGVRRWLPPPQKSPFFQLIWGCPCRGRSPRRRRGPALSAAAASSNPAGSSPPRPPRPPRSTLHHGSCSCRVWLQEPRCQTPSRFPSTALAATPEALGVEDCVARCSRATLGAENTMDGVGGCHERRGWRWWVPRTPCGWRWWVP